MVTELSSDEEIINALTRLHGGQKKLAKRFNIATENISHWRNRGIPAAHRIAIFAIFSEFGINLNAEKYMANQVKINVLNAVDKKEGLEE